VWALLIIGLWWCPAAAADSAGALETVRRIVIQHQGRHKPFDSFAREVLDTVTGSSRWGRQDPVATVLSIIAQPDAWQQTALIAVPFVPLREALGLERTTTHVSYDALVGTRRLMRMLPAIVEKQQRDVKLTMLEHEAMDAFVRFVTLNRLFEHEVELAPPPTAAELVWRPILAAESAPTERSAAAREAWVAFVEAWRVGEDGAARAAAGDLADTLRKLTPGAYPPRWRVELEVWYNHVRPFAWAIALYALAAVGWMVSAFRPSAMLVRWAAMATWAGYAVHASGIALRVVLGGRPPVSNFFETMLWLPFVIVTVALVYDRLYSARIFRLTASTLAAIILALAERVPLDASITPVVAVLRSHLWLTVHVLIIVASYGALALAMGLAHLYGVVYLARGVRDPGLRRLGFFLYRAIQVGVVLLAGGIMLGAVWANASWGRYWGWDPKETWALITLLWFVALLHGRFAGWIRTSGMVAGTIVGFLLLLMTYYGVSFYLVGLHSYAGGHAKPLPALLVGYVAAELAFMAALGVAALRRGASSAER
jgi:ABC-type transport system involved in cytochrome c biogenesis permease subunit